MGDEDTHEVRVGAFLKVLWRAFNNSDYQKARRLLRGECQQVFDPMFVARCDVALAMAHCAAAVAPTTHQSLMPVVEDSLREVQLCGAQIISQDRHKVNLSQKLMRAQATISKRTDLQ